MGLCGSRLYEPWLIPLSIRLIYPFLLFLMLPISCAQWFGCADCHSLIPLLSLIKSMISAYYVEVCILYPQYHDYDAALWLTLSSGYLMLLHVSCDIQTSLLVVVLFPSGLMLILWFLVYVCLRVDCLVMQYVTTLEVHAVSLINSWCTWRAWTMVIGLLGVKDSCVVVVRSVCMSC